MFKIAHRVNTIEKLNSMSVEFGVEVDIHAYQDRLVVHHDAFVDAVDFNDWLAAYRHRFVILNVKEEGIESKVIAAMNQYKIQDFFILDMSFPALVKILQNDERRVALRVSEYEQLMGREVLLSKVNWIWMDMFSDIIPIDRQQYLMLKDIGVKICLVSPELHGRDINMIKALKLALYNRQIEVDAVCTKYLECW